MEAQAIPVLHVADAAAAVAWYGRLGFTEQWVHRSGPGCPAFVSIARDRARLSCPSTGAMPGPTPWSICT